MKEQRQMRQPEIVMLPDAAALTEAATRFFVEAVRSAIAQRGWSAVALSGGSTPRALYRRLAQPPVCEEIKWHRVHLFWGDERAVPPDHPESNYRMAKETLLDHLPIPPANVHRILSERGADAAAEQYETELRQVFGVTPGEVPVFDLILLGIGADGHTASLFPHTAALAVRDRLVVANEVPQIGTTRITFTAPLVQAAALVIVLATGPDKADAVARAIEGPKDVEETPAQLLRCAQGRVVWLLDRAAGSRLASAG